MTTPTKPAQKPKHFSKWDDLMPMDYPRPVRLRPLSQPKRAEKAKQSVNELADAYAQKTYKTILDQGISRESYLAGYRAANRRAK